MSELSEANRLLQAAQRDLNALSGMLDSDVFAEEIFGFHVQQATEKLFKAWLAALGKTYPYTHDLNLLLQMLTDLDCDVTTYQELTDFNIFAVQLRYDALDTDDEDIDREDTIGLLQSLFNCVEAVI